MLCGACGVLCDAVCGVVLCCVIVVCVCVMFHVFVGVACDVLCGDAWFGFVCGLFLCACFLV